LLAQSPIRRVYKNSEGSVDNVQNVRLTLSVVTHCLQKPLVFVGPCCELLLVSYYPFKDEAQTALFKDLVRTAL